MPRQSDLLARLAQMRMQQGGNTRAGGPVPGLPGVHFSPDMATAARLGAASSAKFHSGRLSDMVNHPSVAWSKGMAGIGNSAADDMKGSIWNDVMGQLSAKGIYRDETGTWRIRPDVMRGQSGTGPATGLASPTLAPSTRGDSQIPGTVGATQVPSPGLGGVGSYPNTSAPGTKPPTYPSPTVNTSATGTKPVSGPGAQNAQPITSYPSDRSMSGGTYPGSTATPTRAGDFPVDPVTGKPITRRNAQGQLVDAQGNPVSPPTTFPSQGQMVGSSQGVATGAPTPSQVQQAQQGISPAAVQGQTNQAGPIKNIGGASVQPVANGRAIWTDEQGNSWLLPSKNDPVYSGPVPLPPGSKIDPATGQATAQGSMGLGAMGFMSPNSQLGQQYAQQNQSVDDVMSGGSQGRGAPQPGLGSYLGQPGQTFGPAAAQQTPGTAGATQTPSPGLGGGFPMAPVQGAQMLGYASPDSQLGQMYQQQNQTVPSAPQQNLGTGAAPASGGSLGASGTPIDQYDQYFIEAGQKYGVPPEMLKGMAMIESGQGAYGPDYCRSDGSCGIMQVKPGIWDGTAGCTGQTDPECNIMTAAKIISDAAAQCGGLDCAITGTYFPTDDVQNGTTQGDYLTALHSYEQQFGTTNPSAPSGGVPAGTQPPPSTSTANGQPGTDIAAGLIVQQETGGQDLTGQTNCTIRPGSGCLALDSGIFETTAQQYGLDFNRIVNDQQYANYAVGVLMNGYAQDDASKWGGPSGISVWDWGQQNLPGGGWEAVSRIYFGGDITGQFVDEQGRSGATYGQQFVQKMQAAGFTSGQGAPPSGPPPAQGQMPAPPNQGTAPTRPMAQQGQMPAPPQASRQGIAYPQQGAAPAQPMTNSGIDQTVRNMMANIQNHQTGIAGLQNLGQSISQGMSGLGQSISQGVADQQKQIMDHVNQELGKHGVGPNATKGGDLSSQIEQRVQMMLEQAGVGKGMQRGTVGGVAIPQMGRRGQQATAPVQQSTPAAPVQQNAPTPQQAPSAPVTNLGTGQASPQGPQQGPPNIDEALAAVTDAGQSKGNVYPNSPQDANAANTAQTVPGGERVAYPTGDGSVQAEPTPQAAPTQSGNGTVQGDGLGVMAAPGSDESWIHAMNPNGSISTDYKQNVCTYNPECCQGTDGCLYDSNEIPQMSGASRTVHPGYDIGGTYGEPFYAPLPGYIVGTKYNAEGDGCKTPAGTNECSWAMDDGIVEIVGQDMNGNNIYVNYDHALNPNQNLIGQNVDAGTQLAQVGDPGTGAHTHVEVHGYCEKTGTMVVLDMTLVANGYYQTHSACDGVA